MGGAAGQAKHESHGQPHQLRAWGPEGKKVKSYPSSFLRILAECIRIKYRSEEKGIEVMNQKSGDFAQYSLPRLSVYSNDPTRDDRGESRKVDNSNLNARRKGRENQN